ncbi:MAG: TonB-dependent receptor [Bacteroidales bacterium]|nr:TonB-dependent receptor [Bacteroidales bacterium]
MKKIINLLILTVFINTVAFAQNKISGSVKNSDGEGVPFANVTFYFAEDSTKLFGGTITDFGGNYEIKDIKNGVYFLTVSAIGIKNVSEKISVSDTSKIVKNFTVEEDITELSEIEIKDYRTKNFTDHKEITFSKQQIETAYNAQDLMKNVSGIKIDPLSGSLKSTKKGDVKILINGISASDNDLKQLSADKIAKVEFFTIPPARYAEAGSVLNVITKEPTNGISGGVDLTHAFTTGFGDDMIYFNAVKGNSKFSLSYVFSWRDYKDRISSINYDYTIGNRKNIYQQNMHDKFGYTTNNPEIKYTYSKPQNIVFQATFTPVFTTRFSDAKSDVDFRKNDIQILGNSISKSDENTFKPSLDLYFSKNLADNQELSINLVGTYFDVSQKEKENGFAVTDNSTIFDDDMNLENSKKSLISELAYKIDFNDDFSFSTGYKGAFANSDFKISNILSNYDTYKYSSKNENDYFYGELSGGFGEDFSFRASAGATFVKNENNDAKYDKWLFTPQLVLNYAISETQNLTLDFSSKPDVPSISQFSSNAELLIPNVLRIGNPQLKTAQEYSLDLNYTYSSDKFDLNFDLYYGLEQNAVNTYYTQNTFEGEDYIFATYQNAKNFKNYGLFYDISYYPFEEVDITLNIYGYLFQQELSSNIIGNHNHFYCPFFYYVEYTLKGFEVSYIGNIPCKGISGSFLQSNENQGHLFMSYKFNNNIKLSAGCYWIFTKSKYDGETLPSSLLYQKNHTHIDDNKSMFVLGFAWNFSKGKAINVKQKLHNKDNDQGSF